MLLAAQLALVLAEPRIKHFVVIYFENRAFDHFFGHQSSIPGIDRLKGNESNPKNLSDPSAGHITVFDGAPYIATSHPQHGYLPYQEKFDIQGPYPHGTPRMDGFVATEAKYSQNATKVDFVMQGFSDGDLPISATLAKEFAVFDHWYAAFPGPSWPNHMMSISATSNGDTQTGDGYQCQKSKAYPQKTIFDSLLEAGHEYARIYNDSAIELYIESFNKPAAKARTQNMDRFFSDAAKGTLPALTWIAPRQGVNTSLGAWGGPNSDHPNCCDVALGERLRKDVYEALRAGPGWNETALLFTWDDPGGFFDHVPPPMSAPAPDEQPPCFCGKGEGGCKGSDPRGYNPYTRLGSRLPVVLASPWVKKGTVVGTPSEAHRPFADSQYDGTSIAATLKRLFGLPSFLTKRDAWAVPFDHLFEELDAPRSDAPMHLPPAPTPGRGGTPTSPWGTDCDDPTRRMRRSLAHFEAVLGEEAPPRLHACAAPFGEEAALWTSSCEAGTMQEATSWLGNATERWRRRA
jgi:phospholipase C